MTDIFIIEFKECLNQLAFLFIFFLGTVHMPQKK